MQFQAQMKYKVIVELVAILAIPKSVTLTFKFSSIIILCGFISLYVLYGVCAQSKALAICFRNRNNSI